MNIPQPPGQCSQLDSVTILIRVANPLFCQSLCHTISSFFPTATCQSALGDEWLEVLAKDRPDILVIETTEPNHCSFPADIYGRYPKIRMLLLLPPETPDAVKIQYLLDGAVGYIRGNSSPERLIQAIEVVSQDQIWAERKVISMALRMSVAERLKCMHEKGKTSLSHREREVFALVSSGLKFRDVARKLCLSENTIKGHLQRIYKKLGVRSKIEAMQRLRL